MALVLLERLGELKNQPHKDSTPRPSDLWHSASTNYDTARPSLPSRLNIPKNINPRATEKLWGTTKAVFSCVIRINKYTEIT
jgi:hypothetical protein